MRIVRYDFFLYSGLIALLVFAVSHAFPFFWDTIQLASKQATFVYETGQWLLPDRIDSGHPPGFGFYLAAWWQVLGRSLWVSHLAMLPWVWLLLYQLFLLCHDLLHKYWYFLAVILLVEPVLLGQIVLVSPDIVLLAAFTLGVRQCFQGDDQNNFLLFFAGIILSLISTRGWIAAFTLYLLCWLPATVYYRSAPTTADEGQALPSVWQFGFSRAFRSFFLFLPAGIIALTYLYAHYRAKGWVGYHADSPWMGSFQTVGPSGIIRNIGLLGWRWLDLGRIGLWIILPIAIYRHGWRTLKSSYVWWLPLAVAFLFQLLLAPLILPHLGLIGARYLLPAILFFDLWVVYTLVYHHIPFDLQGRLRVISPLAWQKKLFALAGITLFLGNFLVYPQRIAQSWDATPAHIPYYQQTQQLRAFLREQGITEAQVLTVFPSAGPQDWTLLNNQSSGFSKMTAGTNGAYFYVSSIHNDWTDAALDSIEAMPIIWQQTAWNGVQGTLYHR